MLQVPVIFQDIADWVRKAANAINQLIGRADALEGRVKLLEAPSTGQTRYTGTTLEWWDGDSWEPVP